MYAHVQVEKRGSMQFISIASKVGLGVWAKARRGVAIATAPAATPMPNSERRDRAAMQPHPA